MRSEKLYDAITNIRDALITEAENAKPRRFRRANLWKAGLAAAALLLACTAVYIAARQGVLVPPGGSAGSAGHTEGTVFMSYAGPVFPLSLTEAKDGITADRKVVYDLAGFGQNRTLGGGQSLRYSDLLVSDETRLTNQSDAGISATLLYPFTGSLMELGTLRPTLRVDGEILETELYAGWYSGGFTGVWGRDDPGGTANLKPAESWEDYKELLSDGEYLRTALSDIPALDQDVIVYELQNAAAPRSGAVNPTLAASFSLDYDKTTLLSYGFHGAAFDPDKGSMRQSFSIPTPGDNRYGSIFCLIVLGEDIRDLQIQGYRNGGCHEGEELEGASADVVRYEARLGDVLWRVMEEHMTLWLNGEPAFDKEMFYRASVELLQSYGALSPSAAERYTDGWLSTVFSETRAQDRVFYLSAEITIPAGESVTVTAEMVKHASYDFYCTGSDNQSLYGFDLVTRLGSVLPFESMGAELQNPEGVLLVRQNFGFDLEAGVIAVTLDPAAEQYYMEIRAVMDEQSG